MSDPAARRAGHARPEVSAPPTDRRRGPRFTLLTSTILLSAIALVGGFLVVNLVLMPSFTRQGRR